MNLFQIPIILKFSNFRKRAELIKQRRCLLLVEDTSSDAGRFTVEAKELGWDCDVATTAEEAHVYLRSQKYPIVVVDMRLPGMPGWTFFAQIREKYRDIKIVAMAGDPFDLSYMPRGRYGSIITKPDIGQTFGPALRELFDEVETMNHKTKGTE